MSIWGILGIVVAVLLVAAVLVIRGGREGRELRRELRRLRADDGLGPNTGAAAELRRNMTMDPLPGRDTIPGGP